MIIVLNGYIIRGQINACICDVGVGVVWCGTNVVFFMEKSK